MTAMFGGAPPPIHPRPSDGAAGHRGDDDPADGGDEGSPVADALAKYLLCTFAPWKTAPVVPIFPLNAAGLTDLCQQWDRHDASLINRQRYRYLRNVMLRGHRCSRNETITTLWRSRNSDWWKDLSVDRVPASATPQARNNANPDDEDPEAQGRLPSDADIFELTNMAAMGKPIGKAHMAALQAQYAELFPVGVPDRGNTEVVYASAHDHHAGATGLREFASKMQKMTLQHQLTVDDVNRDDATLPSASDESMEGVHDPLGGAAAAQHRSSPLVAPCFLSME